MNGTTGSTGGFAGSSAVPGADPARSGDHVGAAFRHAPIAMLVADSGGHILEANGAFGAVADRAPASLRGRCWPELLAEGDRATAWDLHRDALSSAGSGGSRVLRLDIPGGAPLRMVVELRGLASPHSSQRSPGDTANGSGDGDGDGSAHGSGNGNAAASGGSADPAHSVPSARSGDGGGDTPAGADIGGDGDPTAVAVLFREPLPDEETLRVITELRTENSGAVLWTLDLRTGRLGELFGPSPLGRMLSDDARDLEDCLARVHRDDIARVRDALEASHQGRDYEQRFRMFDRTGEERSLHARARFVDGERPRLIGIIDDVTEHVQLVRRLADRRRIEAAQGRQVTELAAKLVSATTIDEVTGLLTDEFVPIFGGTSAHVMLVVDGALRASPASSRKSEAIAMIDGRDAADTAYPMGAVVQDRQPRFFESRAEAVERFPAAAEILHHTSAQSWATVPIFGDRRVALGVWQVAWNQPHHATPDERALMLTLAGLAGQALQRVSRQQAELELADAMQRRMLPPLIPGFAALDIAVRYLPARAGWRVCGDFYDVIKLPDDKVGLVVGDVQGHGVEAAAAMGQIRVAFRAYATNQSDPGTVLAETNRLLGETGEIVFATCGYLVLDLASGEMQAAWAGQPPAVIGTADGFELWEPETGPPVGVEADVKYPVSTRRLRVGECLLVCSDGLVESSECTMDDGLEQVGVVLRDQADSVGVQGIASALTELVPAGRGDDIAILVVRMAGAGSRD
ncbi:serine phosphatase RsbU (regulator of sigma subunit)/PAS domain-containing protein [Nocardiopsis mwathae]|uniref:Serine phosphatase RsbU (Regulator of sigma subunit)/PAS domain-containing protein n=1 Tax=Nocardiopsis mwathae TaxID=1472723 RepID=A0A7W9YF68_9ACTN|nr:serine phosphatase RsbU (regulator of sigma subunit)/PAS domain-containing protein [Nocardiopsis mwathae]